MKLQEILSPSFSDQLRRIRAGIAERAARHLIIRNTDSVPTATGDLVRDHLSADSLFCKACVAGGYLTREQMLLAARRYRLGMARDGGVIFWQIGLQGQVFDGKVMYYRADCHRDHHRPPTWVSAELKRFYLSGEPQLAFALTWPHCLFGTHLLSGSGTRTVAVVEAEKTAFIMSGRYPSVLWLAAGGISELTPQKLFPLRGRKVILFPDTDPDGEAYRLWYAVARRAERLLGQPLYVSALLEQRATPAQKARKIDIADLVHESECLGAGTGITP